MENKENHFAKISSEAIKSLVSRAVPGIKKTQYIVKVFEGKKIKTCRRVWLHEINIVTPS